MAQILHENKPSYDAAASSSSLDFTAPGKMASEGNIASSSPISDYVNSEKGTDASQPEQPSTLQRVFSALTPDVVGRYSSKTVRHRPWLRTFVRWEPLSGIFAMCLAIASIFASLGILLGSDGEPIDQWPATPSTYLAIFTAFANLSMRYAALNGEDYELYVIAI